jgi:hypothetical protein
LARGRSGDPHGVSERDDFDEQGEEPDPRGGLQSDAYRHADPRDLVEHDGVVMSGPGGTPQEREPEADGDADD